MTNQTKLFFLSLVLGLFSLGIVLFLKYFAQDSVASFIFRSCLVFFLIYLVLEIFNLLRKIKESKFKSE